MNDWFETDKGIRLSWFSEISAHRRENQDNFYIAGKCNSDMQPSVQGKLTLSRDRRAFVAVFDGMGGEENGAMAALTAAQCMEQFLPPRLLLPEHLRSYYAAFLSVLEDRKTSYFENSGTTCAGVLLGEGHAQIFWMGDSRVYISREDRLLLLTHDHTVAQREVDAGKITEAAARASRAWHMLHNYMGDPEGVFAMVHPLDLQPGDKLLLCSDGISDLLEDGELQVVLRKREPLKILRRKALREAKDNATAILVEMDSKHGINNVRRIRQWIRSRLMGIS